MGEQPTAQGLISYIAQKLMASMKLKISQHLSVATS